MKSDEIFLENFFYDSTSMTKLRRVLQRKCGESALNTIGSRQKMMNYLGGCQ